MNLRVLIAMLASLLLSAPAKAADYIVYTGYSLGTVTFFNYMIPDPPVTKAATHIFTFVTPTVNGPPPIAVVQGSMLSMAEFQMFGAFQATACLATPPNGQLPTTSQALIANCGTVLHYGGKNVGFGFEGNFYKLEAEAFSGTPSAYGVTSFSFADVPAVPEPSTWLMMLAGIGAAGWAMRRARFARPQPQRLDDRPSQEGGTPLHHAARQVASEA